MEARANTAFDEWVRRLRPRLVRAAHRILRDPVEAENIVQATLLAVWQRHTAEATQDLDAYAKRAVWLSALRLKGRRRPVEPIEALDEAHHHASADTLDRGLSAWDLERAIAGLPPPQQAVLRLRFYGGMSFQEIGRALSISMNTAASRCRYAVAGLRRAFTPKPHTGEKP